MKQMHTTGVVWEDRTFSTAWSDGVQQDDFDWNRCYRSGTPRWDSRTPDPALVSAVEAGALPQGKLLVVGCGTGANARFLAAAGWKVVGIDFAPRALEIARSRGGAVDYVRHDILAAPPPGGPFDAAFDRGCFHVMRSARERATFAERIASTLHPDGIWMSLIGSPEGAPRPGGPPTLSMAEIAAAVEPTFAILAISCIEYGDATGGGRVPSWRCFFRRRPGPAGSESANLR